jgi:hypothetical protein
MFHTGNDIGRLIRASRRYLVVILYGTGSSPRSSWMTWAVQPFLWREKTIDCWPMDSEVPHQQFSRRVKERMRPSSRSWLSTRYCLMRDLSVGYVLHSGSSGGAEFLGRVETLTPSGSLDTDRRPTMHFESSESLFASIVNLNADSTQSVP